MRNVFAVVGALGLLFGGLGWYLGWYDVKNVPTKQSGKRNFNVEIDTAKIVEHGTRIGDQIRELITPMGSQEEAEMMGPPPELVGPPEPE